MQAMQVQIPGYRIKKVLGKGGMATVYLAVQDIFEREVALKVMSPSLAEDPSFGQRFMREAQIVSQLVHPNIVTVFDVGVHQDFYYLSMEYIAGPDLKQACNHLSLLEKIAVIEDVARALDFAGSKGYVHRDIKPENIILRDPKGRAVLMDFGIARAAETDFSVTQTGASLGTPHYMSPEQAKGQPLDHRTDLYSLGVVLYFVLMGRVPYHADSAVAIGIKHITDPVPVLPSYLQPFNPFVTRLMAKNPDQRYQNAADLLADLARLDRKKALKLYAQKPKFGDEPELPYADSAPTVIEDMPTRLENAVDVSMPTETVVEDVNPFGAEHRGWWLAAVAVFSFAAVLGAFVLLPRMSVDSPDTPLPQRSATQPTSSGQEAKSVAAQAAQRERGETVRRYEPARTDEPSQKERATRAEAAVTQRLESVVETSSSLDQSRENENSVVTGTSDSVQASERTPKMEPARPSPADENFAERLGSGLASVVQRFSPKQRSLVDQVQDVRRQMRLNPNSPRLQHQLDNLAFAQFDDLNKQLDRGEHARVSPQLVFVKEVFPDYPSQLAALEERARQRERLESYNLKAQERMAKGQFFEPADDCAEYYYFEILTMAPDMISAHQGLVEMARRAIAEANRAFSAGDLASAETIVNRLLAIDPNHIASLELQKKILRDSRRRGNGSSATAAP